MARAVTLEANRSVGGTAIPIQHGLMNVRSNRQMMDAEKRLRESQKAQDQPHIRSLARYVRDSWEQARRAKIEMEDQLLEDSRQRNGEYDPAKLQAIREQGGSEVFIPITARKSRALEAWIMDILSPTDEKPWMLEPTPIPELPQPIVQEIIERATEAYTRGEIEMGEIEGFSADLKKEIHLLVNERAVESAQKMENKIYDQLVEGGFFNAFREFVTDLSTFPAAFMKGPIIRTRAKMSWVVDDNGQYVPEVSKEIRFEYQRISPFDIYPAPESTDINDGYLIERLKLHRDDLVACKGTPGFNDLAIDQVLLQYGGGVRTWTHVDQERSETEDRPLENAYGKIETIEGYEFWGKVQGSMLIDWGMENIDSPVEEYEVTAWLIGSVIVRAVLNPAPLGRRPYYKSSFEHIPGSFWGRSLPRRMRSVQGICNAAARALVNNLGVASGPQVAITDIDRLPPGEDISQIYPFKIWQFNNATQSNVSPIEFFQPNPMSEMLMSVFREHEKIADDDTGIPAYAHGNPNVGGAGNTASGLSMLLNSAARQLKQIIMNIDKDVVEKMIQSQYEHNMRYLTDNTLKGDITIRPRGALSLIVKEQTQMRRNEFLATTANPIDMEIIGLGGRAAVLRETVKSLDMPADKVVPDDKELLEKQNAMAEQAQAEQEMAMAERESSIVANAAKAQQGTPGPA